MGLRGIFCEGAAKSPERKGASKGSENARETLPMHLRGEGGARGSPSPWRREKSRLASPPLTRSAPCNKHIIFSLHFGATKTQNRKNSQNKQCAAIRNSGVAGGVLCSNNRLSHFPGAICSKKYVFVYKELNFTTNLFRIPRIKCTAYRSS